MTDPYRYNRWVGYRETAKAACAAIGITVNSETPELHDAEPVAYLHVTTLAGDHLTGRVYPVGCEVVIYFGTGSIACLISLHRGLGYPGGELIPGHDWRVKYYLQTL